LVEVSQLQVNNGDVGTVPGNRMQQIIQISRRIHDAKVIVKGFCQRLGGSGIALGDNNAERFHSSNSLQAFLGESVTALPEEHPTTRQKISAC
jgi:hypothetical protein